MQKDKWCSCNPLREAQAKAAKWDAIVRCKECKHYYEKSEEDMVYCLNRSFLGGANYAETEPGGFCAWGKKFVEHECEAMRSAIFSNEREAEAIEIWNRRANDV